MANTRQKVDTRQSTQTANSKERKRTNGSKKLAKVSPELGGQIIAGMAAGGKLLSKAVAATGSFISKHPALSLRAAGAATAISGVKDIIANKDNRSSLGKGIVKTVLGTGLTIFNDSNWYTKNGNINPAMNTNRPMNAIYNTPITLDPTVGGVPKLFDLYLQWNSLKGTLPFETSMELYFRKIREELKSNLVYESDKLKDYVIDALAVLVNTAQIARHLALYNYATPEMPDFYNLYNTQSSVLEGYGPVILTERSDFKVGSNLAATIAKYDVAVPIVNNLLLTPGNLGDFVNYYFNNVFVTDTNDTNTQYIQNFIKSMPVSNGMKNYLNLDTAYINTNDLNIQLTIDMMTYINREYAVLSADLIKAGLFKRVLFPRYDELRFNFVYSEEYIQAIINAYTPEAVSLLNTISNEFVRLDAMSENSADNLTTFLFLGNLQNTNSPLYAPLLRPSAILAKIMSNSSLSWDQTLFQGSFDTSKPFGILMNSNVVSSVYSNINVSSRLQLMQPDENGVYEIEDGSFTRIKLTHTASDNTTLTAKLRYKYENPTVQTDLRRDSRYIAILDYIEKETAGVTTGGIVAVQASPSLGQEYDISQCKIIFIPSNVLYNFEQYAINGPAIYSVLPDDFDSENDIVRGAIDITDTLEILTEDELQAPFPIRNIADRSYIVAVYNIYPGTTTTYPWSVTIPLVTTAGDSVSPDTLDNSFYSYSKVEFESETLVDTNNILAGFTGLVAWMNEIMDYHLPVFHTQEVIIDVNGTSTRYPLGSDLCKETYIPFWYNLKDLDVVAYNMIFSLLV